MATVPVTFKGDHSSVDKSVNKVKGGIAGISVAARGLGTSLKSAFAPLIAVGAALGGIALLTNGIKGVIDAGGDLDDLSAKTGTAAGELLVLQNAFELAGVSADSVSKAVIGLNNKLEAPTPKIISTLKELGVSLDDLQNMSMAEKFDAISSAIGGIDDVNKRAAVSSTLFGRNLGQALLPLFTNKGAITESARAIGGLADTMDKNATTFAKLGDAFDTLGIKSKQFFGAALGANADRLDDVAERFIGSDFTEAGRAFGESIRQVLDNIDKALGGGGIIDAFLKREDDFVGFFSRVLDAAFQSLLAQFGKTELWRNTKGEKISINSVAISGKTAVEALGNMGSISEPFKRFENGVNRLTDEGITLTLVGDALTGLFKMGTELPAGLQLGAAGYAIGGFSDFFAKGPPPSLIEDLQSKGIDINQDVEVKRLKGQAEKIKFFSKNVKMGGIAVGVVGLLQLLYEFSQGYKEAESKIRTEYKAKQQALIDQAKAAEEQQLFNETSYDWFAADKKKVTDDWFLMMKESMEYAKSIMAEKSNAFMKNANDWLGLTVIGAAKAKIMKPEPFKELGGAIPLSDLQRVGGAKIFSTAGTNSMLEEQRKTNATLQKIYEEGKRRTNIPNNLMSVFA
jgi:hypothetical protein